MKTKNKFTAPKAVVFAIALLLIIVSFVTVNTIFLSRIIGDLELKVRGADLTKEEFDELYADFVDIRTYLSITVNHEDIATVETEFAEICGALSIKDTESASIAKSRLCGALGHLKRLSGFNIDSVI